jgi:hypothetical protein
MKHPIHSHSPQTHGGSSWRTALVVGCALALGLAATDSPWAQQAQQPTQTQAQTTPAQTTAQNTAQNTTQVRQQARRLQAAQQSTPTAQQQQAAVDAARALGRARATQGEQGVRDGTSEDAVRRNVAGYTATPPATQVYSSGDTSSVAADQQTFCAANPRDSSCLAQAAAARPRGPGTAAPSQQALASRAAVRDPNSVLGDVANTYNACAVGGRMIAPETWAESVYGLATGAWTDAACTKTLTVNPVARTNCQDGAVIATATGSGAGGPISATIYCSLGTSPMMRVQIDAVGSHGSCSGPLTALIDLGHAAAPGGSPIAIGQIAPHWGGGCYPLALTRTGSGCVNGSCQVTIHFSDVPGTVPTYGCTIAGAVTGDTIAFNGPIAADPVGACFAPYPDEAAANGLPGNYGTSADGTFAFWAQVQTAIVTGWQWTGTHYQLPLAFPQPRITEAAGEYWSSDCASLEGLAPRLPDGMAAQGTPMPIYADLGAQQCVRTASTCTDGPATRVLDGVSVARGCWAYQDRYACTQIAATPSTDPTGAPLASLTADVARTCERSATQCLEQDQFGHCTLAGFNYRCRTGAAQFEPALNCGNASYCAGGSCWDSSYPPNSNFSAAYSQYRARVEAARNIDSVTMTIFKGRDSRCHRENFGIDNCCEDSAYLQQCSQAEQDTVHARDAGRCHFVGEYCSARSVLGICRERTSSYCCFSSLLGRLVQEQGRVQLARDWGPAQAPNCVGFSPDVFAQLDWSRFDLSEFYAQIQVNNAPAQTAATTGASSQQPACYYGAGQCGGGR